MINQLIPIGGWAATTLIVIALFVRIEHRITRVEVLITIIAGKIGLCLPNSEKDTQ